MNEEPKSIWKKSWTGPHWLRAWLILVVVIYVIGLIAYLAGGIPGAPPSLWPELFLLLTGSLITATVFVLLWLFVRCFFSRRNFKRLLFGLACFATLIALFYAEEDWRGWHAWNQFKHAWEAKGEHFDMASVTPAPVPADQNFALTPIAFTSYGYILTRDGQRIPNAQRDTNFIQRIRMPVAHDYNGPTNVAGNREKGKFTDLEGWQRYYRELAATTNLFAVPAQSQSPAADVLLALSKYDPVIEELRVASRLPASRFPLEYTNESPADILLPHLSALKGCAQVLQLRSLAELQNGQPDKALNDVTLALQLAGKINTEPFLISHLVRISMVQLALQPVWEGLARQQWFDAQLVALDAELAGLNFLADYQLSLHGELGCQDGEVEHLRRHPEELRDLVYNFGDNSSEPRVYVPEGLIVRLVPAGWFYQNQLRCDRMMVNYFIPVADLSQSIFVPSLARQGDAALEADTKPATPFNLLERLMLPALGNSAKKFAWGQASVDMARTALALERYRLAHGEFPESLDTLAPQFIAKVPHDVIGGQPLKYRRDADGRFVLYSIGWNETDDGGVVAFHPKTQNPDISQGDWVWRYPKAE